GIALARSTTAAPACGPLCAPPPPPCVTNCPRAAPGAALAGGTYTSSAYGFTVQYPDFSPSRQDDRSLGWDLSGGSGQYSIDVVAGSAGGRTSERVLDDIISANFPDYSYLYRVPGAELGYNSGAGAVYDGESSSFFGSVSESRVAVLASTRGDLAIAVVGAGDAAQSSSDHPDPSGLPVSGFID